MFFPPRRLHPVFITVQFLIHGIFYTWSPPGPPGQVQDLQDHLQDLQEHLQDLFEGGFDGF